MIRKIFYLGFSLVVSACSQVDSVKVFDQQQAAIFLQQTHQAYPAQQMIKLSLPQKENWKKLDVSMGTLGTPIMLVPNNENMTNWTQSIRTKISAYRYDPNMSAKKFVEQIFAGAKTTCAIADGKMISEQNNFVTYQLIKHQCGDEKDQMQIGKAFNGNDAIYAVYYSHTKEITPKEFNAARNTIMTTQLIANPSYLHY